MELTAQVIADTHGSMVRIREDVDLYVLLGDVEGGGWLYDLSMISKRDEKPVLCVLGNHDDPSFPNNWPSFERGPYFEYRGLSFCLVDGCMKEKGERTIGRTQREYETFIRRLPPCDVILSHAPPSGIYEPCDLRHEGIRALAEKIWRESPYACLYGHQHVARTDMFGRTFVHGTYGEEKVVLRKRENLTRKSAGSLPSS